MASLLAGDLFSSDSEDSTDFVPQRRDDSEDSSDDDLAPSREDSNASDVQSDDSSSEEDEDDRRRTPPTVKKGSTPSHTAKKRKLESPVEIKEENEAKVVSWISESLSAPSIRFDERKIFSAEFIKQDEDKAKLYSELQVELRRSKRNIQEKIKQSETIKKEKDRERETERELMERLKRLQGQSSVLKSVLG